MSHVYKKDVMTMDISDDVVWVKSQEPQNEIIQFNKKTGKFETEVQIASLGKQK